MSLPFLDETFILRNCIQQIELDVNISEKLEQTPIPPTREDILGHTVQRVSIFLPRFSCTSSPFLTFISKYWGQSEDCGYGNCQGLSILFSIEFSIWMKPVSQRGSGMPYPELSVQALKPNSLGLNPKYFVPQFPHL